MRIISGAYRGRKLRTPAGQATRPTSDQVKENIFNIIQFDIENRTVLDLFCGSGQLGLEAVSRGAKNAVFVDMSAEAMNAVRANIKELDTSDKCRAAPGEVLQFLSGYRDKADLIFLDPPYHTPLMEKALSRIEEFDILRPGGIMVCEHDSKDELPELDAPYEKGKSYKYGNKMVTLYFRF